MDREKKEEGTKRNLSLDLARCVALLAVIMIHISDEFVSSYKLSSLEFYIGTALDGVSRLGVPLFVMISGSLFLDERRTVKVKKLYFKNIRSLIGLLLIWSALYSGVFNVILPVLSGKAVSVRAFINDWALGHYHMWYLYMIIGLYVITPFLREIVKKRNKQLVLLFIGLALMVQFSIPVIRALANFADVFAYAEMLIEQFRIHFLFGYTTYYLAGWYIVHIGIEKKKRRVLYCLSALSLLGVIVYTSLTHDYSNAFSNLNIFIFLYASGVFVLLNNVMKGSISDGLRKVLVMVSKMSFGIYIIHPLLITVMEHILPYHGMPLLYMLVLYVIVFILSFVCCSILSRIPGLRLSVRM